MSAVPTPGGASPERLLAVAREAAAAGAEVALDWAGRRDELRVEEKQGLDDLVSQADRDSEDAIREVLARDRPDDAILGEERPDSAGDSGIRWHVDPIDGTTNYLYGRPDWAVSVAAADAAAGTVLAGVVSEPALGLMTSASRGGGAWLGERRLVCGERELPEALVEINFGHGPQRAWAGRVIDRLRPAVRAVRRGGSAAAALAQIAGGRADAYWGPGLRSWDVAAGLLIVTEAGGTVGDLAGPESAAQARSGDVLAASSDLWPQLRDLIGADWRTRRDDALQPNA